MVDVLLTGSGRNFFVERFAAASIVSGRAQSEPTSCPTLPPRLRRDRAGRKALKRVRIVAARR